MTKSNEIKNLAEALTKFQAEVPAVTKDAENPFFRSKYADLTSIIETIRKPLAKNGLSYVQFPSGENGLTTILMHVSGEWIEETFTMQPVKNDPQGKGSCISYMRRYSLQSILGLAAEDDDGNAASASSPTKPGKRASDFETAQARIRATKSVDKLLEAQEAIPKSKLYTNEEKNILLEAIQEELDKVDATQ